MSLTPTQQTLEKWHGMLAAGDLKALPEIIHPEAVFRSPVAHTPYQGAMVLCMALNAVYEVFSDFTYHREFLTEDHSSAVLEFSAKVGDKSVKGIDMIAFDADGKITAFEVMIRPLNGLQALAAEMGERIGPYLAAMNS